MELVGIAAERAQPAKAKKVTTAEKRIVKMVAFNLDRDNLGILAVVQLLL